MTERCDRCCGNGEIVTDWQIYLHPPEDADPDAGTSNCPVCGGTGYTETNPPTTPEEPQ
jgi:RNA polymerase subunit RPABC4/transcription elongation factor Spt4